MSSKDIVDKVMKKAEKEAERKVKIAKRVAQREEKMIEKRTQDILEVPQSELEGDAPKKKRKILGQARLKAKNIVSNAKTSILQDIYERLLDRLSKLERDDDYLKILVDLSVEGIRELDGQKLKVRVNTRDKNFLQDREESFFKELEERLDYPPEISINEADEDIIGGVIVTTPDERVSYINSFQDILDRNWDKYRKEIVTKFLENESTRNQ